VIRFVIREKAAFHSIQSNLLDIYRQGSTFYKKNNGNSENELS
jgi:hypothetical protein